MAAETRPDPWSPVRRRAGHASLPGERRPATAGEDEGHGAAANGRLAGPPPRLGARGRRRGYAELGLEGAVLTASAGSEFGGRPRVRPPASNLQVWS